MKRDKPTVKNKVRENKRKPYQSEPRENQIEKLVKHFHVDPELAKKRVWRAINIIEVEGTVNGGEEWTVEPSSTLGYQFRNLEANRVRSERNWLSEETYLIRYIRNGVGGFDIVEGPWTATLGYQFPAKDLMVC